MSLTWEEGERVMMIRGPGNESVVGGHSWGVPLPAKATITRITETPRWEEEFDDVGNATWHRAGVDRRLYLRLDGDGGVHELSISDDREGWNIRKLDVIERLGDLA